MGCNSSSVVPLGETDIIDGAGIKVRVNPSTPETIKLSPDPGTKSCLPKKVISPPLESSEPPVETLTKDFNTTDNPRVPPPPPMAFEVPVNEESIIKKHPPKRFRRLEELQTENQKTLTHEWIDIKQQEAEMRRKEILSQRIQSAQQKNSQNRKLVHSDAFSQESDDFAEWEKNICLEINRKRQCKAQRGVITQRMGDNSQLPLQALMTSGAFNTLLQTTSKVKLKDNSENYKKILLNLTKHFSKRKSITKMTLAPILTKLHYREQYVEGLSVKKKQIQ